jgi:hypothetical protein
MAELAGVEAEHRVLAETLIDAVPPNDVGFEAFRFLHVHAIVIALEQAGIGFGRQGSSPGRFYHFPRPAMPPPLPIRSNQPATSRLPSAPRTRASSDARGRCAQRAGDARARPRSRALRWPAVGRGAVSRRAA